MLFSFLFWEDADFVVVDDVFLFRVCISGYFRVPLSRSSVLY